jgi:hypothetical protein
MQRILSCALTAIMVTSQLGRAHAQQINPARLTIDTVNKWHECPEYLPERNAPDPKTGESAGCRIEFDMTQTKEPSLPPQLPVDGRVPPQVHKDVAVWPGPNLRAAVVLRHSSPFVSCSLATSPSPLARDESQNIATLLTGLGGFGAPAVGEAAVADFVLQSNASYIMPSDASSPPPDPYHRDQIKDAKALTIANGIIVQLDDLKNALSAPIPNVNKAFKYLRQIKQNLAYSYPDDAQAATSISLVYEASRDFLALPVPDAAALTKQWQDTNKAVNAFAQDPATPATQVNAFLLVVRAELHSDQDNLKKITDPAFRAKATYLADITPGIKSTLDLLISFADQASNPTFNNGKYSEKILPIASYPENKVGITVQCVDAVTTKPLLDNIQFNVYYQRHPVFDISTGFLVSFLKGRQVGTQVEEPSSGPSGTPTTVLAVTSSSRVQFVPGAFIEYHPLNFRLPWAKDPAIPFRAYSYDAAHPPPTWMSLHSPRHPFGYVGSLGLAAGFLVNPNNGTAQAEFFEGISLGIQRFSILIGNHTGRSQNFTGGYTVGQVVASGVTPPTVHDWGNGLAIGLAYRVVLR